MIRKGCIYIEEQRNLGKGREQNGRGTSGRLVRASVLSVRQDADGCASSVITESAYDSGLPVSETWSHGDL